MMSFKRDGDDSMQLHILRKRRIKDLLGEGIPEDEAKLLANGRLACLVCSSNPVFDTLSVLTVHRHGKKHLSHAEVFEQKKEELRQLVLQRRYEEIQREGKSSISMPTANHKGRPSQTPYDPTVRKRKHGARKERVQLDSQGTGTTTSSSSHSHWQDTLSAQMDGPMMHCAKLKNVFQPVTEEPKVISPYQPKSRKYSSSFQCPAGTDKTMLPGPSMHVQSRQVHAVSTPGQTHHSLSNHIRLHHSTPSLSPAFRHDHVSTMRSPYGHRCHLPTGQGVDHSASSSVCPPPPPLQSLPSKSEEKPSEVDLQHSHNATSSKQIHQSTELSQKHKLLQGSGWKRDWDGKWIKDENAEFDSDEEPPDF